MKRKILYFLSFIILSAVFFSACGFDDFINIYGRNVNIYEIDLELDETEHKINASQKTTYINKTDTTLDSVCFHLYPNSFSESASAKPVSSLYENKAYPNGKSYGKLEISLLKEDGKATEVVLEGTDKTILKVNLSDVLYPNEKVVIEFQYQIVLPNVNHRFGYGDNTINLGNFYPIACVFEKGGFVKKEYHSNGDPFYSDFANYNVTITHSKNLIIATSGNIKSQIENGEKIKTVSEARAVRDFAMVLSDKFEVLTQKVGDTEVKYYYYQDENAEKSLQTSVLSLTTFSEMIGVYPYRTLSVVQSNFIHGGMEYPNLVLISDALDKYEDYENTIIHEIAHQWWYGVVGNNEFSYGWLDEGLTEYTTALFYEKNEQYNVNYETIIKNANSSYCLFVEVYEDIFGEVDTSMNRDLDKFATEPEYVYIAYVKGMLMFDGLRSIIGNRNFIRCLRHYYNHNMGRNVLPSDLISSFESASLRSLESFFKSWIDGIVVVTPAS